LANFELKNLISTFTGFFMKKNGPNYPDFEEKKSKWQEFSARF
jgi:hypothetical protein